MLPRPCCTMMVSMHPVPFPALSVALRSTVPLQGKSSPLERLSVTATLNGTSTYCGDEISSKTASTSNSSFGTSTGDPGAESPSASVRKTIEDSSTSSRPDSRTVRVPRTRRSLMSLSSPSSVSVNEPVASTELWLGMSPRWLTHGVCFPLILPQHQQRRVDPAEGLV